MVSFLLCLALSGIADLEDLARRYEIQWTSDPATGRHVVRAGANTIVFSAGFPTAIVNGSASILSMPATIESGRVKLPPELARYVEMAPLRGKLPEAGIVRKAPPIVEKSPPRERRGNLLAGTVIAVDAGHGGRHTGGVGRTGLMEKDINLGVALALQETLESWGAKVVMTRTSDQHFDHDVDDDLNARVNIVNGSRAELFISVHTNYVATAGPRGFEVWVPRCSGSRDRESRELAGLLREELGGIWGASEDRGTKDDHNLRVLKGTRCPAALVELEFVSNPAVERQLAQASRQRELGAAIADAARDWVLRRR